MNETCGQQIKGANKCEPSDWVEPQTVGKHLDRRIANLRDQLERACIAKAKAETAQLLHVPLDFIRTIW